MQFAINLSILSVFLFYSQLSLAFLLKDIARTSRSGLPMSMMSEKLTLHGSPQTRSPLVNWYLLELNIPFTQAPPFPSKHPFGQVPFLSDGDVEVFESGAILLYIADKFGGYTTPEDRAKYTKWVVWANSELDGLCFGAGMRGTSLDKPNVRALDTLEKLLGNSDWLVDNKFSIADVAVASYLNYVPVFFRDVNPSMRPNIVRYMTRSAERPSFAQAFGREHANIIQEKAKVWLEGSKGKKGGMFGGIF